MGGEEPFVKDEESLTEPGKSPLLLLDLDIPALTLTSLALDSCSIFNVMK